MTRPPGRWAHDCAAFRRARIAIAAGPLSRRPRSPSAGSRAARRARARSSAHVVAEHGDVPDLAPGADRLAVEVDLDAGIGGHHVEVPVVDVGGGRRRARWPSPPWGASRPRRRPAAGRARPADAARTAMVTAPSMVQCPLLCGRIASSLTSRPAAAVSNSSTASSPVTPSSAAIRRASDWAASARSAGPGPGRARSPRGRCRRAGPSRTTGHAAPCRCGERATRTASSRSKLTYSSAISRRCQPGQLRPPRRVTRRPRRPCRRSPRGPP